MTEGGETLGQAQMVFLKLTPGRFYPSLLLGFSVISSSSSVIIGKCTILFLSGFVFIFCESSCESFVGLLNPAS